MSGPACCHKPVLEGYIQVSIIAWYKRDSVRNHVGLVRPSASDVKVPLNIWKWNWYVALPTNPSHTLKHDTFIIPNSCWATITSVKYVLEASLHVFTNRAGEEELLIPTRANFVDQDISGDSVRHFW